MRTSRKPENRTGCRNGELNQICLDFMNEIGVESATIGYQPPGYPPFTGAVCTSVNHVICHGIPGDKKLKASDVLNIY